MTNTARAILKAELATATTALAETKENEKDAIRQGAYAQGRVDAAQRQVTELTTALEDLERADRDRHRPEAVAS